MAWKSIQKLYRRTFTLSFRGALRTRSSFFNIDKCSAMCFNRANTSRHAQYFLGEEPIASLLSVKDLGVLFDPRLIFHDHIKTLAAESHWSLGFVIMMYIEICVYDYFDKYTFLCEMYDEDADIIVELTLNFFPFDNSCQVINSKKGKNLLRRVHVPYIKPEMLQIGNIVNIYSKLLLIKDCAPVTMRTLFSHSESTFAMIKPVSASKHGKIITFIMKRGFRIVRMKNGKLTKEFAMDLYKHLGGSKVLPLTIDYITSGEVIGLELVGPDAVKEWRRALGATDPAEAAPGTLRKMYGENKLKNIAHAVNTRRDAIHSLEAFFGLEDGKLRIPFRATFQNCTCCVIKPHVTIDGNVGSIMEHIATSDKFYVSAMAMFSMNVATAKEFYEVYRGVLPTYEAMCIHLAEGKCTVLEVKCNDPSENVVCEFRKLCGPRDPEICRQLYPDSIRALYGKTIVHNAVHCTDLPEDGEMEVEYFFKLLACDNT